MATDVFQPGNRTFRSSAFATEHRLANLASGLLYGIVLSVYVLLFVVTLITVGFVEIRQANMPAFNALIGMLEQRDSDPAAKLDEVLKTLGEGHARNTRNLIASLPCPTVEGAGTSSEPHVPISGVDANAAVKSCEQIKQETIAHANSLFAAEDEILLRRRISTVITSITRTASSRSRRKSFPRCGW